MKPLVFLIGHYFAMCQATSGGYMVAFAGRKYAARSPPVFVSNSSYTVTSFTLVRSITRTLHSEHSIFTYFSN